MAIDILVFAAHPDDAELSCGGTVAALTAQGKKVGIVDFTRGEMGTRGTAETRKKEAEKAGEILGLSYRTNLDLGDSFVLNNRENQLKIINEIRKLRPHICITGAPYDRHPDHGKATRLSLDALFYSGLKKIETKTKDGSLQTAWRPKHILHYMQDRPFNPDFVFDITDHWEAKKQAMLAYNTQLNVEDPGEDDETYISTPDYFKQIEARARYFGHLSGFAMGEPFRYHNGPVGLTSMNVFLESNPKR